MIKSNQKKRPDYYDTDAKYVPSPEEIQAAMARLRAEKIRQMRCSKTVPKETPGPTLRTYSRIAVGRANNTIYRAN